MQGTVIEVATGEVKLARDGEVLRAGAIGSCVVVAVYDCERRIGGMAHVMLPKKALKGTPRQNRSRYAEDALLEMVGLMQGEGGSVNGLVTVLAGGGNVLQKDDDTICQSNIVSVLSSLEEIGLPLRAEALGGMCRRSLRLDVTGGVFHYTEGDGGEEVLWRACQD